MRQLAALGLLIASTAYSQPCASVPKPASNTAYWAAHEAKKADTSQPDVIFVGDSITQRWETDGATVWADSFVPDANDPNRPVGFACGGSGDTTQSLLGRIGEGGSAGVLSNRGPVQWVVLLIGTNNLPASGAQDSAWWIWHGILRDIQAIRQRLPGARLMVVSILPRAGYATKRADINGYLAESVQQECNAVWLDVEADMAPGGTMNPALYQADNLHLTAAGYEVLAARILGAMNTP